MPNDRRAWLPGGTHFFTVDLLERRRRLLVDHIAALRAALASSRAVRPFDLVAMVVLPGHLHCVWTLQEGDAHNGVRWAHIKSSLSRALPLAERRCAVRIAKGERGIWQRRY